MGTPSSSEGSSGLSYPSGVYPTPTSPMETRVGVMEAPT